MKQIGNVNYVSAQELIKTLKFQSEWEESERKLKLGDNDANFELIMNSTKAIKDGADIQLSQPVVKEGGTAYVPVSDLADLFQEDMSFDVRKSDILIHASPIAIIEHEDDTVSANDNSPNWISEMTPLIHSKIVTQGANAAMMPNNSKGDLQVWSSL